jgi:ADP-heptose:LPS heptosyltransferase
MGGDHLLGARASSPPGSRSREVRRIAVLRALKLGDLLCTVPAFRALRAAYPLADIRLIGLPWMSELVRRYDTYLDGLFELPGFPGMPERPFDARAFTRFLDEVQSWGPDLVLQIHGSGDLSNPLAMLLGGRTTAGYYLPGQYCPDPEHFIPYPADLREVSRHLRLLEHLGIPARGVHKELSVHEADHRALVELLPSKLDRGGQDGRAPSGYAVIHPGASVPERRWPPERFAAVGDALAERGLQVVLTGGPEEAPIVAAIQQLMRAPGLDLTGRTTLGTLGALLEGADLLVSNDTGVMHVAEAVGTPLVAVSFDPESWRWAPFDAERHRVLLRGRDVQVPHVLAAATTLLGSRTGTAGTDRLALGQTPDGRSGQPARR